MAIHYANSSYRKPPVCKKPECPYEVLLPYPEVKAECPNREYARAMLSNMASRNSEMNAISLYFYNSLILSPAYESIATCFEKISQVEMHHLDIFGQLAFQLGANPRLWTVANNKHVYWSPSYNQYPMDIHAVLLNSIEGERAAIGKYTAQAQTIKDANVVENLNRIILDECRHEEVFKQLCEQVKKAG